MNRSFQRCITWNSHLIAEFLVDALGFCLCFGITIAVCCSIFVAGLFPITIVVALITAFITILFLKNLMGFFVKYAFDDDGFYVRKLLSAEKKYVWHEIYKIDVSTVSVNKKEFPFIRVFFQKPTGNWDKKVRYLPVYMTRVSSVLLISHSDELFLKLRERANTFS